MIVCPECGTRNEDDEQFCGGCGTYLEWTEPAEEPVADAAPAVAQAPVAEAPVAEAPVAEALVAEPAVAEAAERAAAAPPEPAVEEPLEAAVQEPVEPAVAEPVAPEPVAVAAPAAEAAVAEDLPHQRRRELRTAEAAPATAPVAPPADVAPTPPDAARTGASRPPDVADPRTIPDAVDTRTPADLVPERPDDTRARPAPEPEPVRPTAPLPPPATSDAQVAAAALVAPPPARPQPAPTTPRKPAAVKPGVPRTVAPPKRPVAEEQPPAPGDLICGSCGAGNQPSRKFCRRCGHSLVDAKVAERRSWWSRLWRPEPKKGPAAGYRPHARRRFPTRPVVAIGVIAALVGLGFYFRPEISNARISVLDRIQGNVAVNPTAETASSQLAGHEAQLIRDGTTNLSWMPADPGEGVGQFVDFQFAQPFRLVRLLVQPGASDVEKDYLANASPKSLTLVAVTSTGAQQTVEIPLQDKVGLQNATIGIDDVVGVRLLISSTYRATPQTHVAIAEVEFRGRT